MGTENRQIQMVVFDWAGTTVDYGSSAPSVVFDRVLTEAGLHLTREEINRPMGLEKKAHIRQLLSSESGSAQWQQLYGRVWNEQDVDKLYETFEATLHTVVAEYSTPLPGVVETVDKLRGMGLKIGSTTGYNSRHDGRGPARSQGGRVCGRLCRHPRCDRHWAAGPVYGV